MERVYQDAEREALAYTQPQERPAAVLLGGQPGAGKSALAAAAVREFKDRGGAVLIDADRMREFHPLYQALARDDPRHAADRTHPEAAVWATRLTATAMEQRRNLVVDGTMRDPANVRALAQRLRAHGYEVEARVLAVHPDLSLVRARLRFEEQVAERGTGRYVNQAQHDTAVRGLAESVVALERDKLVDAVRLYDTHQLPVYENRLERGKWQRAPEAARALEAERARPWSYAERRDYVAALAEIAERIRGREQVPEHVTYAVGAPGRDSVPYVTPRGAGEAFARIPAEERPFIVRYERGPDGQEAGSVPGQTSMIEKGGVRSYEKWVGDADLALKRAYEAAQDRLRGGDRPALVSDLEVVMRKLETARGDLSRFEQSPAYRRAQAFEQLSRGEALSRHPELDGAYKQLHEIKQRWTVHTSPSERENTYFSAVARLSDQLHRGELPRGNVTLDESQRIIDLAAQHRGLLVREPGEADFRGEVVAASSHHALLQVAEGIAVRYEKARLDRELQVGQKVAIQHGAEKSQVLDHAASPAREAGRDQANDLAGRYSRGR